MTAAEALSVTQRRYVSAADAHYGGNLVDGAYVLALFGDAATEACIRMDGDEACSPPTPTSSSERRSSAAT